MIRLQRTQVLPIGVDIGLDSVKMLQLEVTAEQTLSVVAAAKQSLPEEAAALPIETRIPVAIELIKQMIRQNGFHGRDIVAALPREIVHVKNLRLPMIPPAEIDAAVQFEARNVFPFDTDQAHVRHLYAGEVRQGSDTKQEVIVLAAKHDDVDLLVEQLNRAGCGIASLDLEPSAIYRTVERFIRRREDENEVHVLVDIGARQSQLVVGKGRDISFFKPIDIGARSLHEAVARKLQITVDEARSLRRRLLESAGASGGTDDPVRQAVLDATRSTTEELSREISLCLRYYTVTFRGHRPAKLRLLGGEAADSQLQAALAASLPIPVDCGRPLFSVNTNRLKASDRRGGMTEWAVAFGLSLKATRCHFGARDGKQREHAMPGTGTAEVIDLASAIQAPVGAGDARTSEPPRGRSRDRSGEVVHA
jgi:type IV pilus assembly protein PilM